MQETLAIIKPNAVKKRHIGDILSIYEKSGLLIKSMKMKRLSAEEAEGFYQEHRGKPFFPSLVKFMTSGPIVLLVLQGDDAIALNRKLMGSTNPQLAALGTIRKLYADSLEENAVHGSDSPTSAAREISFFAHEF